MRRKQKKITLTSLLSLTLLLAASLWLRLGGLTLLSKVYAVAGTAQFTGTATNLTGDITAQRLLDTANTTYLVDPAGTGNSLVTAGTATISGYLGVGQGKAIRSAFGPLSFEYKSGLDAWTTAMTIQDSTGRVGIGTTSPTTSLDLGSGNLRLTGLQGVGTNTGNGGSGSIYFLNSSGTTNGRIDTATLGTAVPAVGSGADGAVTVAANKNINVDPMASGRSAADGADYDVTAIGTNTVTLGGGAASVAYWKMDETSGTSVADSAGTNTGTAKGPTPNVAYWKMDEASGTSVADSSGNNYTGTATGTTVVAGKYGNGRSFNGSSDYINTALNLPGPPVTFEAWVYPTGDPTGCGTFMIAHSGGYGYYLRTGSATCQGSKTLNFDVHDAGGEHNLTYTYASYNTWYHVAGTYDGGTQNLYINGTLAASQALAVTPIAATGVDIGGGTQFSQYFLGSLDDFRIYNSARTATQITDDMNNDAGPSIVTGKYSNGRSFGGGSDYIDVTNSTVFDVSSYTIEAWVYSSNFTQNGFIFEKGPVNTQYSLFFEGSNVVQRSYNSAGALLINQYTTLANAGISNSNWYHLASTYDGSNIKLYVNGNLKSNVAVAGTLRTGQSGERIGAYGGATPSYFFNGTIDEVKIYNYARSDAQVAEDMHPLSLSLAANDEVLLMNLQGDATNNGNVGNYETLTVQSISGSVITFTGNVAKTYGVGGNSNLTGQKIVLQRLPNYTNVTINSGVSLVPRTWTGTRGGVVAFRANGTITVTGTISTNGLGYVGGSGVTGDTLGNQGASIKPAGQSGSANSTGGGGGLAHNPGVCNPSAGGGGGYGTAGATSTNKTNSCGGGGVGGGTNGAADLSTLFMGGAGGGGGGKSTSGSTSGAGGNGGGIVYVTGKTISVTGSITANGTNGGAPTDTSDNGGDGGGGGAGGSIFLRGDSVTVGTNLLTATGGSGNTSGTHSNGGDGGSGRIRLEYASSLSGTTNPAASSATISLSSYGNFYIGSNNTSASDLAEYYLTGDSTLAAGDVVGLSNIKLLDNGGSEIVGKGVLKKTDSPYAVNLLGVISTSPGVLMGSVDGGNQDSRMLALSGRAPVKISPDSEPIAIDDFLTSSSKPGLAQKATQTGYTLGRALETWQPGGSTTIDAFISPSFYLGSVDSQGNLASLTINDLRVTGTIAGTEALRGAVTLEPGTASLSVAKSWDKVPLFVQLAPSYLTTTYVTDLSSNGFTIRVGTPPTKTETVYWQAWW